MQAHRFFSILTAVCSIIMAAPIGVSDTESYQFDATSLAGVHKGEAPRCGYVRLNQGDAFMVGVYTRAKCEPIWKEQAASIFRIDTAGCSCQFFSSKESCSEADPVPTFTGPTSNENMFAGEKPTYVYCKRT